MSAPDDLSQLTAVTSLAGLPNFRAVAASYLPAPLPTIDVPVTTLIEWEVDWAQLKTKKPAEVAGAYLATATALPAVEWPDTVPPELAGDTSRR